MNSNSSAAVFHSFGCRNEARGYKINKGKKNSKLIHHQSESELNLMGDIVDTAAGLMVYNFLREFHIT